MGTVSSLASAEEVQSAGAVRESSPGRWGEAEGRTETTLTFAGLSRYTENLSWLPQGSILDTQHNRSISQ